MKTVTYLRFSLLIPFVVWGLSLLVVLLPGALSETNNIFESDLPTVVYAGLLLVMFYAFGIIIWIFPYLLLSLILFFASFIMQARTAFRLFALSPLAMTLLTVAVTMLFDLGSAGGAWSFPTPGALDQNFVSFNALIAGISLLWGYICVGIGYGIYKLLQRRRWIHDESAAETVSTLPQPS